MSFVSNALSAATGFSFLRRNKYADLKVLFHKDALPYGQHGSIYANSVKHRFEEVCVRFVFVGVEEVPKFTPELMAHIWDRAAAAGFEALYLNDYTTRMRVSPGTPLGSTKAVEPVMDRAIPVASSREMAPQGKRVSMDAAARFDQIEHQVRTANQAAHSAFSATEARFRADPVVGPHMACDDESQRSEHLALEVERESMARRHEMVN